MSSQPSALSLRNASRSRRSALTSEPSHSPVKPPPLRPCDAPTRAALNTKISLNGRRSDENRAACFLCSSASARRVLAWPPPHMSSRPGQAQSRNRRSVPDCGASGMTVPNQAERSPSPKGSDSSELFGRGGRRTALTRWGGQATTHAGIEMNGLSEPPESSMSHPTHATETKSEKLIRTEIALVSEDLDRGRCEVRRGMSPSVR